MFIKKILFIISGISSTQVALSQEMESTTTATSQSSLNEVSLKNISDDEIILFLQNNNLIQTRITTEGQDTVGKCAE